jgi:uncharacterized protein YdaU (DUF1376 family)
MGGALHTARSAHCKEGTTNFYKRHLGDYAKDTKGLTMLEHGAYNLLLDFYYSIEKPLPRKKMELFKICQATHPRQRQAVNRCLSRFFSLTSLGYINKRAQEEIQDAQIRITTARNNGLKGGFHTHRSERNGTGWVPNPVEGVGTGLGNSPLATSQITTKTLLPPAQTASREASGLPEVVISINGGSEFVRVRKPRNRRLWTQREKEALVGQRGPDYVYFFERKGFHAELIEKGETH